MLSTSQRISTRTTISSSSSQQVHAVSEAYSITRDDSPLTDLEEPPPSPPAQQQQETRTLRRRTRREGIVVDDEVSSTTETLVKKKRKGRRKQADEPVVYDIEPVIPKDTNFRGRLGFACLNTILREAKPDPIFCSRTCRIDSIKKKGMGFVKDIALRNVLDLAKLIQWNEDNRIRFMRVSSDLFPFASHEKYGYDVSFAAKELKDAGDLAKKYGHRLTTHPGQFTQLGSIREEVITASVRELEYHNSFMKLMGIGPDGVIIIHMGGVYGDKEATIARFRHTYETRLTPDIKQRLVLENDEICYNLDDLMPICEELNIPIVVDYHHDWLHPSSRPLSELIPIINQTWLRKGIRPKQHLSSPRSDAVTIHEKRAHGNRCYTLPEDLPVDMDLMIEAKEKEQAVFHLYRIYGLEPVKYENLRPARPESTETEGQGNSKRKKGNRQACTFASV